MLQRISACALLCFLSVWPYANSSELSELDEILALMQEHLINRETINWPETSSTARAMLTNENDAEGKYRAIHYILAQANTNHSFYRSNTPRRFIFPNNLNCKQEIAPLIEIPKGIGYVKVQSYQSGSWPENQAFAEKLNQQILAQDSSDLKGWIVDLQTNRGGNMWPMLTGLSALLGNGTHGYFFKPDGEAIPWGIYKNSSFLKRQIMIQLSSSYVLKSTNKPVAILSSKRTASSGEAILIALQGLENSKSFGQHSCGQSTANRVFALKSGNQLTLTVSYMADKNKRRPGGSVLVDQVADSPVKNAIDWITSR
ncbi:S41 family peptidase [Planctobacterium marinum]|uniref:Peptidase S41 n=1 Tax=Planctobacterium marinum TaxID=1631968 RepID=A0AA48KT52_9ALTE|nr:peptidase S41 [Planctobacterium marinum]